VRSPASGEVERLLERAQFVPRHAQFDFARSSTTYRNSFWFDSSGRMTWYCLVRLIRMSSIVSLSLRLLATLRLAFTTSALPAAASSRLTPVPSPARSMPLSASTSAAAT